MPDTHIPLTGYLFARLHQLGIRSVHGVPGDYNLVALDYVTPAGLRWVGNANELNAGYAADGYARIAGLSALFTTGGVGELSTLNAVAGAYSERAPVVHVVGTPPTSFQDRGLNLHHSLGDGNLRVYASIYEKVTCAQANLRDATTAPQMIDDTLRQCLLHSRPVYIELPADMVTAPVPASLLDTPINTARPPNDPDLESTLIHSLLDELYSARQPLLIIDGMAARYHIEDEVNTLVHQTGFLTTTTAFGKGIVQESHPTFYGVYTGAAGNPDFMHWVQSCDLVLRIGSLKADSNSYGFTALTDSRVTIELDQDLFDFRGTKHNMSDIKSFLQSLLREFEPTNLQASNRGLEFIPPSPTDLALSLPAEGPITHDRFWTYISRFFGEGDTIMTETGTSYVGSCDFILPANTTVVNSGIWLSIGYMLSACSGAALAQKEMVASGLRGPGRTILFEGDGSFQVTAQAVSDIIRNRIDVTIFLLNNDGYTIERYIHGMQAEYNDVQPWRYLDSPWYFGAPRDDPDYPVFTKRVTTWSELADVLDHEQLRAGKGFNMVEIVMPKEDAHPRLKEQMRIASRQNNAQEEERL
ncbi:pyruvate decarboxylase [Aspergillus heteromorphus CBS 117.55]|uniref:Pyruvate decarboxylase n=1 Tax=Aspergillus heteromorphus CBS 117.55 TaxID=1448321 RepID=A0A317VR38_9EURO|nr:pyruvate decarboxylase [Aspergillus heteromorphus CBS 117.55]PWY75368.1 pyruvate decarboxylase [Aspergillus heteromorphus CBS 117.55]